jgi:hypothetical protein
LIPGFIAALFSTWIVSLFTEPAPKVEQAFEDMLDS